VGRPLKIAKSATIDTGYDNGEGLGIVGGDTGFATLQIVCQVKIGANPESVGYIIRQKGATKYIVTDGTNTGICALADKADGTLDDGDMTVTITKLDTTTARLSYFGDTYGRDFTNTGYNLTFGAPGPAPQGSLYEIAQVASA
jgi:hypothetical protein